MKNIKRDRFERLGAQRTTNVLKTLKVLGNCANTSAYEYTQEDVDRIFSAIEKQVKTIKNKFQATEHESTSFKF